MKIYTKRGDAGMTDLFGGQRVKKNDQRVKAYGDIDLANSAIALAHSCAGLAPTGQSALIKIMKLLFVAGAEVATANKDKARDLLDKKLKDRINDDHIAALEDGIDAMEGSLPPLKSFILPTGHEIAARLHFARAAVRRAEISLIELNDRDADVRPEIIKFFNRLSDFLFVMARWANAEAGGCEIGWNGQLPKDDHGPLWADSSTD